jgi:tetratricopeptide (TPR) repeat protein
MSPSAALLACLFLPGLAAAKEAAKDPVETAFSRADWALEAGRFDEALTLLEEAMRRMPPKDARRVRCHERLGAVHLRRGEARDAKEAFSLALQTARNLDLFGADVARAYAGMGLALLQEGRKDYALRFFKKGLLQEPDEGTRMFLEEKIGELGLQADQ